MPPKGRRPPVQQHFEETESDSDETIGSDESDRPEFPEGYSPADQRTLFGLKALAKKTREEMRWRREQVAALELELLAKLAPLAEQRRQIVVGEKDVTEEEAAAGVDAEESKVEEIPSSDDEADEKAPAKKAVKFGGADEGDVSDKAIFERAAADAKGGIPMFWLRALQKNEVLEGFVMPHDVEALKALTNIEVSYPEDNAAAGFTLTFTFAENDFFTNTTLTKTYIMDLEDDDDDVLDKATGTEIEWKEDAKLTVVVKERKQRNKKTNAMRIIKSEEKRPSFFHFFSPPEITEEEEDEEDEEGNSKLEELEMDYEMGTAIRGLVPRAVHSFTGEALAELMAGLTSMNFADHDEEDEDDEEFEDEDEDEEEESDEEEAVNVRGRGRGGRGGGGGRGGYRGGAGGAPAGQQECKQQ